MLEALPLVDVVVVEPAAGTTDEDAEVELGTSVVVTGAVLDETTAGEDVLGSAEDELEETSPN